MKKISQVLFISVLLIFASCDNVYFEKPIPQRGFQHYKFPKKLQGKYVDGKDTLTVNKNDFSFSSGEIKGSVLKKDTIFWKKFKSYYIINGLEKNGYWSAYLIKRKKDTLFIYTPILSKSEKDKQNGLSKFEKITKIKKARKDENPTKKMYILSPSDKELKQLIKDSLFVETMKLVRIK